MRGPIVDRNGEPLALSAETRSVYARPKKVVESSTPAERSKLAAILMMMPISLESKLNKAAPFVWLERRISPDKGQAAEALGIDGIGTISEYKRFYPESNLAASVVGLAGMDGQGLSGLELQYDRIVRGEAVELSFDHDALGHPIFDSPLALKAPEPGAQLELTIDSSIQSLAETELAAEVKTSGAKRGSVIVLDPFTGEVMAMANVSADGANVHDRLHNPAVEDAFEPGSTMKGMLGSIALADHAITTDKQFFCENGHFYLDRHTIHDHSPHGWLESRRDHRSVVEYRRGENRADARLGSLLRRAARFWNRIAHRNRFARRSGGSAEQAERAGRKSISPITASGRAWRSRRSSSRSRTRQSRTAERSCGPTW